MALRDGLHSGDVHVPGSRRYSDPASFLVTLRQWEPQRLEFCHLTGKPASAGDALALADDELHAALSDLEAQLARGGRQGEVRLTATGELIIPPLTAEDVPVEAEALQAELGALLPRVPIASVLVEVDARTGFTERFPVKGKSLTARHLSRYFARGQGISTSTDASDQHSTFDTKVIVATAPESHYVLDGILGNQTDLPVTEHATDTHGATLVNFALFDLVGLQLSSRIRDLGKITLYRTGPRADFAARYPSTGHLLTRPPQRRPDHREHVGRPAAGRRLRQGGHASAALVVGKLCSSKRQQNALAAAIKEYEALRRTVYAARYLADETYRWRIGRQLNRARTSTRSSDPSPTPGRRAPPPPPRGAGRADVVPDTGDQRRGHLDDRVPRPGRHRAARAATSTTPCWPTSGQPTTRTSTSTAPTPSTSMASSPSSTPTATGRCVVLRSGTGEQCCGYQSWSSSRPGMMTFSRSRRRPTTPRDHASAPTVIRQTQTSAFNPCSRCCGANRRPATYSTHTRRPSRRGPERGCLC
jgi:Tn3 transposase DDE domain